MNSFKQLLFAIILLVSHVAFAQRIGTAKFGDYFSSMPVLQPGMEETLQPLGDNSDRTIVESLAVPKEQRTFLLKAFLERFEETVAETTTNKVLLGNYSVEEQKMIKDFQRNLAALSDDAKSAGFTQLMESRPLLSSGTLSWSKIGAPLTVQGKKIYQQLLSIEKSVDWNRFFKEAAERNLQNNMFTSDEDLQAINQQMNVDKEKIPKKKVQVFEGMNATAEIQDPEQVLKVMKAADQKRQQFYQKKHTEYYNWWNANESAIRQCALSMDALLEASDYGNTLSGNDKQLILLFADVQERIWHSILALNDATRKAVANAEAAATSGKMIEDATDMYKKMGLIK